MKTDNLTRITINEVDWDEEVGCCTTFKCTLPFDLCEKLVQTHEDGDDEGFENLIKEYPNVLDKDCTLDDFQCIFESHMTGEEKKVYTSGNSPISKEEYEDYLNRGLNHMFGLMTIANEDGSKVLNVELYGG